MRLVRSITRQVEAEWDDETRALAEGLERHDREACPGCGLHESILADPEHNHFTFEDRLCSVCKGQDMYGRIIADRDDQEIKRKYGDSEPPPNAARPGDGRHIYLRPMTPEEVAARHPRPNGGDRAH